MRINVHGRVREFPNLDVFFYVSCRGVGLAVAQAYDQHLNMILGEVEETITTVEYDEDTYEEHVKVSSTLHIHAHHTHNVCVCVCVCARARVYTYKDAHALERTCNTRFQTLYTHTHTQARVFILKQPHTRFPILKLMLVNVIEQLTKRVIEMLYVRGDGVILVSPPLRTS
jgi:small nuclear ribonucleoprotein (snRNP)-like protein